MNILDLKGERIFVSLSSISTYHIEHNKLILVVCCCLAGELISRGVVYSEACAGGGAGIHQKGAGLEDILGSDLLTRGECFLSLSTFI